MENRKYLSARQAIEFTGFCERKLYSLRASGEIDYIRAGNAIRYPEDGLIAYFERHRVSANSKSEALAVGASN